MLASVTATRLVAVATHAATATGLVMDATATVALTPAAQSAPGSNAVYPVWTANVAHSSRTYSARHASVLDTS